MSGDREGATMPAIEEVLPHRGAMRLVDRLLECDGSRVAVEVRVPADGPFCLNGPVAGVPAWIGIEYMAQAIAAWAGWRARAAGREPPIGFLVGTRRYEAGAGHFPAGEVLRVEAECEWLSDNGLGIFACRILGRGAVLATANVSVYEPGDPRVLPENGAA